ncbi:MAG: hypothetical protein HQM10_11820 [Candidatus Riflebacteria bacterium]|nr:hypothetical protein [Candidatus Riflebacteria bacterium]
MKSNNRKNLHLILAAVLFLFAISIPSSGQNALVSKMKVVYPQDPAITDCRVTSVAAFDKYVAWGTNLGVLIESKNGFAKWHTPKNAPFKVNEFVSIAFYGPEIWVGCRSFDGGGLFKYDGKEWTYFDPAKYSMLQGLVSCLLADRMNRLWIAYLEFGLNRYVGWSYGRQMSEVFTSIKAKHGLLSGTVYSMADGGRYLWVGTNQGLAKMDTFASHSDVFSHKHYTISNGFPGQAVFSLTPYKDSVAAGTDLGFVVPDGENWKVFKKKDGLISVPVKCMASEGDRVWIGTNRGLQCFENGKLLPDVIDSSNGLPSDGIHCIAAMTDSNGSSKVFIGTDKGARTLIFTR